MIPDTLNAEVFGTVDRMRLAGHWFDEEGLWNFALAL
jgi:hypothetical protein